jgi:hypothetical protein
MPNGFGQGRGFGRGSGGGMGFGFRGSSPPWPYVGRGRGGLPRCSYYFGGAGTPVPGYYQPRSFSSGMRTAPGYVPYTSRMTREDELNYMKDQAKAIKGQLEEIESRIRDLEAGK